MDQHNINNGPHQDQTFDNPAALCLWAKDWIRLGWVGEGGGVGIDIPNRVIVKGVRLSSRSVSFSPIHYVEGLLIEI